MRWLLALYLAVLLCGCGGPEQSTPKVSGAGQPNSLIAEPRETSRFHRGWDLSSPLKGPRYEKEPRYALMVFGEKREQRVWMVLDGTALYVDCNANGDLTELEMTNLLTSEEHLAVLKSLKADIQQHRTNVLER